MANLTDEVWQAEVKRQRDTYGQDAESPMRGIPVPEAAPARLARLAKELAEAAHQLDGARVTYDKAARNKHECQARFVSLSEALLQAIHEHREGAPEGVPYQP